MKYEKRTHQRTLTALLGLATVGVGTAMPTIITPPDTIDTDTVWDSDPDGDGVIDRIYFLDQAVFVGDFTGATRPTLTIAPGTVVCGTGAEIGTDGLDVGSLIITKNGMIHAEGTAEAPIVFTSVNEGEFLYDVDIDSDGSINEVKPDPLGGDADGSNGGEWGGVIILGNAPIHYYNTPTNNLNSNSIEGFAVNAAGDDILYGGNDPDDNSGVFRYASLRFGGFEFAQDQEINGLTMGGVGAGTTIDHVEVVANTDDAFEWFGGTVNTSHLVALYCEDESFDADEGHQGMHQFLFAIQCNRSDHGLELDGGNRTGSGVKTGDPLSTVKFHNLTILGATGTDPGAPGAIRGSSSTFRMKDNFAGQLHNSIFTGSGDDIVRIDDASTSAQVGVNLKLTNNLFGTPKDKETNNSLTAVDGEGNPDLAIRALAQAEADLLAQTGNQLNVDMEFSSVTRNAVGEVVAIDPRPLLSSPAWTTELTAGAPCPVNYRGAFGLENWAAGWTYVSQEGILVDAGLVAPQEITIVTPSDTIDVDTTWDSDSDGDGRIDRIYFLDQAVFVGDFTGATRPTLTIMPGTVVCGTGAEIGTDGLDVGSLIITKNGMINAEGTPNAPIVFTSVNEGEFLYNVDIDGDNVINEVKPDPLGGDADGSNGGEWGGVIILGNAPIHYYNTPTNNLNSNSIEGFAVNAAGDDILYGGDDVNDNSGVFRYASLRFGGFEFAQDQEINGLTMGGVGAGTTIDHVEVVANTDDAFEWFGGTVNTNHLVALYCEDESFDADEGHQGVHQFLFAIQCNRSDHGLELDGGNRTGSGVKTGDPLSTVMFYNLTLLGATGTDPAEPGAIRGSSSTFRMKDNFAGQLHNSIFTGSGDDIVRIDDASTSAQVGVNLKLTYNLFGTPKDKETNNSLTAVDGDGNPDLAIRALAQAEADLLAQAGNIKDVTVNFSLEKRNDVGEVIMIDPRPSIANSPAWGGEVLATGPTKVPYRGAFGTDLWLATWTYVSKEGIVRPSFLFAETPDATFIGEVIEGDEVEVTSSSYNGDTFTINFVAELGASYKVTQSATLMGAFTDVPEATLVDASESETITFDIPTGTTKLFFRIEKVAE